MFGSSDGIFMERINRNNSAIESYYHCKLWINDQKEEKLEVRLFGRGPEIESVQKSISRRLGFEKRFSLGKLNTPQEKNENFLDE